MHSRLAAGVLQGVESMTRMDRRLVRFLVAGVVALAAVAVYSRNHLVAEDFALGAENTHTTESWNNVPYTSGNVPGMVAITEKARGTGEQDYVLWLGNSQLHTINQFHDGDRLAPYWLRAQAKDPPSMLPLGFSLPNANLQEHYVSALYVSDNVRLRGIVIGLCFDDLREDGLRGDFGTLLTEPLRRELNHTPVGAELLAAFDRSVHTDQPNNEAAKPTAQQQTEDFLNTSLGKVWPLWGNRGDLRVSLLTDLYWTRNWLFGIKATTVRKLIPARFNRNMSALEELFQLAQTRAIPVVAYIVPIRQDRSIPYDAAEYAAWKQSVIALGEGYGANVVNLEALVPPTLWGSYHDDDIDFMHFQGSGHRLLGEQINLALAPWLAKN